MLKKVTLVILLVSFISCVPESQIKSRTYQNIVIISDMSSRIDNRPQKDLVEINKILDFFKNECVKPGEKIGDKSSIFFSTFSDKVTASIDIGAIKTLGDKQSYINSTGKHKNRGLEKSILDFKKSVNGTYMNTRNPGLDLISALIEKIENEPIVKMDTFFTDGIDTTYIKYDNHVYIFTDGYLEYLNKAANNQFYFGTSEIDKVRQACKLERSDINTVLRNHPSLCLPSVKNDKNKLVTLHILETHERDKDDKLQTYKYGKGHRDNEILEAIWRKWAIDSGFKKLNWKKY